jgi:protein gp37
MTTNTAIEWCDHTWNPWQGCTHVSAGCDRCYMATAKRRYGQDPAKVAVSAASTFSAPLAKNRDGTWKWKAGSSVFACSWSDWFHPAVDEWRPAAWEIVRRRPGLRFLLLTKRPERIAANLPDYARELERWSCGWEQVALGVTAENQAMADKRIPLLLQIPAAMHFVSVEPMLAPVLLSKRALKPYEGLDWVIAGGESGPGRRPPEDDWFRSLRGQCEDHGIPFFFKGRGQIGKVGNAELDGATYHERPAWLRQAVPEETP